MPHYIALHFEGRNGPLDGRQVTPRGLHGLLYHVLRQAGPAKATWLHKHPAPKPYTLLPYYTELEGHLAGLRVSALTDEAAAVLLQSWRLAQQGNNTLHLGPQPLRVTTVEQIAGPDYAAIAMVEPGPQVTLRILSPASFHQGPGDLPLPLPANVWRGPFGNWQAFAPAHLALPGDWLEWCAEKVFVVAHRVYTVPVSLDHRESFIGFVGEATFKALDDKLLYQAALQSLARLAPYSGIGRKTTMGMGAVERAER